jgi:hypothetical protein
LCKIIQINPIPSSIALFSLLTGQKTHYTAKDQNQPEYRIKDPCPFAPKPFDEHGRAMRAEIPIVITDRGDQRKNAQ